MAPWHVHSANVCTHPPPSNGTQQWHQTMAPSNGTTSSLSKCVITTPRLLHPAMAPYQMASSNGTLPWHLTTCHPTTASSNGTQQWHLTMAPYPMAPYHGTIQWHPAAAPSNGTLPWHPIQWHPEMAPSNGTPSHPAMAPYHGTLPHGTLSNGTYHGTLSNGTQQWHPAMAPSNGSFCSIRQLVHPPPLLLEVRTPIAKAIWGKKTS